MVYGSPCILNETVTFILFAIFRVFTDNQSRKPDEKLTTIASISPQSLASIAAKLMLSMEECMAKLVTFFKNLGFDYVFDTNLARTISLLEMQEEFVQRYLKCFFGVFFPIGGILTE